ncbi:hypothetical protein DBV15_03491 [Temnothorax longispinosus]|uniref:Uncharacterized protein n=1 Tax=Temnothorax longispinosus TaxID=300112 RepID=A0A4S2KUG0_9HYME|nr:hypothetical protein DBV15_03491 [Temnothorax longispinosus]
MEVDCPLRYINRSLKFRNNSDVWEAADLVDFEVVAAEVEIPSRIIKLDSPANESLGIEPILLKTNDKYRRCPNSANKCFDNDTTLLSKRRIFKLGKPRKDLLFSTDIRDVWEAADLLVDFEVVAIEGEISQFDEISESAIVHRVDAIVAQLDVFQIGESGKSTDYNVKQFVSAQVQLFQLRQIPERIRLESADLVLLKMESLQTDQVAKERSGDACYPIRQFSSVNPAKESGATREILLLLSQRSSQIRLDKPANESFGIELILLDSKYSISRCLKSANKYPDNGTTLLSKSRLFKLGKPRKDSLFSTDIRLPRFRYNCVADTFLKAFSRIVKRFRLLRSNKDNWSKRLCITSTRTPL